MKVYALSGIVGSGTTPEDAFRPAVADYPVNWVIAISNEHQSNPNKQWLLCTISGTPEDIALMDADQRVYVFPFGPADLETPWASLATQGIRSSWANRITQQTGVTVRRDDNRSLREIINAMGTAIDPNFDADNMDVRDIDA